MVVPGVLSVIVTATDAFPGSVVVRDGAIATVERGRSTSGGAIDLEGDYLLPGLVELHTDNLEKHVAPRPGVRWPMRGAVLAHDAQIAAAGITTVYDALTVCEVRDNPVRAAMLQFPQSGVHIRLHTRMRTPEAVRPVLENAAKDGALVLFTVVGPELREYIHVQSYELKVEAIDRTFHGSGDTQVRQHLMRQVPKSRELSYGFYPHFHPYVGQLVQRLLTD